MFPVEGALHIGLMALFLQNEGLIFVSLEMMSHCQFHGILPSPEDASVPIAYAYIFIPKK